MKREPIMTLAVVILASSFLALSNCGGDGGRRQSSVAQPTTGLAITTDELYAAYAANTVAADERFKGKVLAISGTVQGVAKYGKGSAINLLPSSGKGVVQCYFEESENQAVARLTRGQQVTVKGRCDQFFEDTVLVYDCLLQ
ncbi:MAG TPA: hypothetical protein VF297_10500 [Pyrinomonadaceae bacterium]